MDGPYIWVDLLPVCAILVGALLLLGKLLRMSDRSGR